MADKKTVKVLPMGTRVRVTNVDMHGHCGREHHPQAGHVGWEGTIVDRDAVAYNEDLSVLGTPRFVSDTEVEVPVDADVSVCYVVTKRHNGDSMTTLELMDFEVREVTEDELARRRFALRLIERHLLNALDAARDLETEEEEFCSAWAGDLARALETAQLRHRQAVKNF